jgi:hypothetical protein
MEFDYIFNGITFAMILDVPDDADRSDWTDVEFNCDNGDIESEDTVLISNPISGKPMTIKRKKNLGFLMVDSLTESIKEEIRKEAYGDLLLRNCPGED